MSNPRTLALTAKHMELAKKLAAGESVVPGLLTALDEFIDLSRELEQTNAILEEELRQYKQENGIFGAGS